ncbi:CBS domain-containing protein [Caldimonas tepidiphila]|uniref:CBS domain-containing protein n=1 Tax=Caldimonas tepidiphila TaxID=2315841 RepID=UPI000E5AFE94|nr:CBS domain-containing protein [Caldimonas tepidiphila]
MQAISQVMTRDVRVLAPSDTLQRAAQTMDELNVGAVPVCDGEQLVGMITDRDIAVRAVSAAMPADSTPVREVMTDQVHWCFEDQDVEEVMNQMRDVQIRRVPVVNHDKKLVGIVSLGDLATKTGADVEAALEEISEPSEPDRSTTGMAANDAAGGGRDMRH